MFKELGLREVSMICRYILIFSFMILYQYYTALYQFILARWEEYYSIIYICVFVFQNNTEL